MWTLEGVRAHIPHLHLIRKALCCCEGGVEGKGEGGLRQETQGCWHVLFFHYVISIPMRSALIFDEPSAQHPPLSPSHPILFSLSLPLLLLEAYSPTCVSSLSVLYILLFFPLELLPCLLEPWYLCHRSGEGLRDLGWTSVFQSRVCFWKLSRDFDLNQPE